MKSMTSWVFGALASGILGSFATAQTVLNIPLGYDGIGTSSTGGVGVGTSAPQAGLDVFHGLHVHGTPVYATSGAGLEILKIDDSLGTIAMINAPDRTERELRFYGNPLSFFSVGVERMRVSPSGAVGVGTSTPGAKLEITNTQPYTVYLSGNAPSLYFGPTPGVFPNGTENAVTAFLGFSTAEDAYGQGKGDINIVTQSRGAGNSSAINFLVPSNDSGSYSLALKITRNGNVGVGTSSPTHKLAVNGTIRAKEIIVDTDWADYVFADDYRLAPLAEVEAHIHEHKHLPGIPSAEEIAEKGVSVGEMQALMMAKIEELTLHVIAQDRRNGEQQDRIADLENEVRTLRSK